MPNHCENTLDVAGPDESVRRFVKAVTTDEGFDIAGLVPMPEELRGTTSGFFGDEEKQKELMEQKERMLQKYGASDWYDWAHQHWGTKWGDYSHSDAVFKGDGDLAEWEISYDTAWCPFTPVFWEKVVEHFPDLSFIIKYWEPGMGYCGATGVRFSPNNGGIRIIDNYVDDYMSEIGGPFEEEETDDECEDLWQRQNDAVNDFIEKLYDEVFIELATDKVLS